MLGSYFPVRHVSKILLGQRFVEQKVWANKLEIREEVYHTTYKV